MVSQDVLSQVSVFLVPCWYVVVSGMLSDQQAFCLTVVQNSFLCTARTLNRLVSGALWMCHSGRVSRQFPVYSSRNLDGSLKAGFLVQTKPIPSLQRLRFRQPRNPERLLFSSRAPRERCACSNELNGESGPPVEEKLLKGLLLPFGDRRETSLVPRKRTRSLVRCRRTCIQHVVWSYIHCGYSGALFRVKGAAGAKGHTDSRTHQKNMFISCTRACSVCTYIRPNQEGQTG